MQAWRAEEASLKTKNLTVKKLLTGSVNKMK